MVLLADWAPVIEAPGSHAVALAAIVGGVAFGVWSILAVGMRRVSVMPELRENAELVTNGPYRLVRHPMYFALLTACGGLTFLPFALWRLGCWVALALILARKTVLEERQLRARFSAYAAYAAKTRRLLPLIW